MSSTKNWWAGEIDWDTPAGQLLQKVLAALPKARPFHFTLYGSAPLQLTVDRQLKSGDVNLFSDDDEDSAALVAAAKLDKTRGRFAALRREVIFAGVVCGIAVGSLA